MTKTTLFVLGLAAAGLALAGFRHAGAEAPARTAYAIGVTTSQQGETPVVAIVDAATGRLRACWLRGPASKPACSAWSD